MPPSRTDPTSFGFAGSDTSNCFISPVPQQDTYRNLSSTERSMSVMSGGTAPKGFRAGGSRSASAGSAGTVMTFSTFHSSPSRNQRQTEAEVLGGDHDADEAPGRLRVVRRADLQGYLVLGAEVDALHVLTRGEVPEVDR